MKGKKAKRFRSIFVVTALTAFILSCVIFISCGVINNTAENTCYNSMKNAAMQFRDEISSTVNGDMEHLTEIAGIIAQYGDVYNDDVKKVIMGFQGFRTISYLEMLLPDDTTVTSDGKTIDAPEGISFEEEAAKGSYISELTDDESSGKPVIRKAVPIVMDGQTTAMLYGIVDVANYPNIYKSEIFSGKADLYIIEGKTGKFIMDTWHKRLGATNNYSGRQVKKGFENIDFAEDMRNGLSGYAVFKSQVDDEYLHLYYIPVGINDWIAMISVPESIAFYSGRQSMAVLYSLTAILLVVLCIYFVFLLGIVGSELKYVKYLLNVSYGLFDSHKHKSKFDESLEIVAKKMSAETAFFIGVENGRVRNIFSNRANKGLAELIEHINDIEEFNELIKRLNDKGKEVCGRHLNIELNNGSTYNIKNYMAYGVKNSEGLIVGVIGVLNMKRLKYSFKMLEDIRLTFSMACNSFNSYKLMREMSIIDALTGIKNRNFYEETIEFFTGGEHRDFLCVYIDVNGLHALNNSKGHKAGDEMLKFIAANIQAEFGDDCYRIGGDEFVVLKDAVSREEAERRIFNVCKSIEERGYHISVGIEHRPFADNINEIINTAERKMQENKYLYYQQNNVKKEGLSANAIIKQGMISKYEADVFLSAIAPRFRGGYLVDIDTDSTRIIYTHAFFEETLQRAGEKFSMALRVYAHEQVHGDYQRSFEMFFDYDWIVKQLEKGSIPSLNYKRVDGEYVSLHISKSPHYSNENHETVWIFENSDNGQA